MILKKPNADSPELKLYEVYVQRITKHYELVLTQFNIYFGINLALMAGTGVLFGSERLAINREQLLHYLLPGISALGMAVSLAWFGVNRDGRRWQLLMNSVLEEVECELLESPSVHGLYANQRRVSTQ